MPSFSEPSSLPHLSLALEPTLLCSAATNLSPCQPQPLPHVCDSKEWRNSSRSCSVHEENGWVYCGRVFRRLEMVLGKACSEAGVTHTKFGKAASCWGRIIFELGFKKKKKKELKMSSVDCWVLQILLPQAPSDPQLTSGDPWLRFKLHRMIGKIHVAFKWRSGFLYGIARPEGLWGRVPQTQWVCLLWVGRNGGRCSVGILELGLWVLGG